MLNLIFPRNKCSHGKYGSLCYGHAVGIRVESEWLMTRFWADHAVGIRIRSHKLLDAPLVFAGFGSGLPPLGLCQLGYWPVLIPDI
jgi:hypothetical protein